MINPSSNAPKCDGKIRGTKLLQNSTEIISSGVPSVDHIIGGGIPVGSLFLVEEDTDGVYSEVLLKYFLAEGIACNHKLFVATLNKDSKKLVAELPSQTNPETEESTSGSASASPSASASNLDADKSQDDMKIAWRYNSLSPIDSTMNSSLQFGHYFDLNKPVDEGVLKNVSIKHWEPPTEFDLEKCIYKNEAYSQLIDSVRDEIYKGGFDTKEPGTKGNILRVAIQSLGSPFWHKYEPYDPEDKNDISDSKNLLRCLYYLKATVLSTKCVIFVTVPTQFFKKLPDVTIYVRHAVHGSIKLESFAGTHREKMSMFRDYHGFFLIPKIPTLSSVALYVPPILDLVFKLRRKKFLIEKLHFPPELEETSEREQDDGSMTCASAKLKNLEF